jgi:hypothetical protein
VFVSSQFDNSFFQLFEQDFTQEDNHKDYFGTKGSKFGQLDCLPID